MLVTGQPVVNWVAEKMGAQFPGGHGLGLLRNERLVVGVVYENITVDGCVMHIYSQDKFWFTKEFRSAAFHVPFVQWGLERVTAPVREDNDTCWRFLEKTGWVHEGTLRGSRPTRIYGMLKSECRWLNG